MDWQVSHVMEGRVNTFYFVHVVEIKKKAMIQICKFERCLHYTHGRQAGRGSSKQGVISLELKKNWQGECGQNDITEGFRSFTFLRARSFLAYFGVSFPSPIYHLVQMQH